MYQLQTHEVFHLHHYLDLLRYSYEFWCQNANNIHLHITSHFSKSRTNAISSYDSLT